MAALEPSRGAAASAGGGAAACADRGAAAATDRGTDPRPAPVHLPTLATGLLIMLTGTVYPPVMADASGRADHGLAMALFWAMSAGFVRGVGFVPRLGLWRLLFSGWACTAAVGLALVLKLQH